MSQSNQNQTHQRKVPMKLAGNVEVTAVLVGVAHVVAATVLSRSQPNNSFKPTPLRGAA